MKKIILSSVLFSSISFASPAIIESSGEPCPRMYMKLSGVCVNPEKICDSRNNLKAAVSHYISYKEIDKQYDCAAGNTSLHLIQDLAPSYSYANAENVSTISQSCIELKNTLDQYQLSGVTLLDPSTNTVQKMDSTTAQQVIQRVKSQFSNNCQ